MADQTPRLKAPYIIASQSQKEVTHNMALNILDALVQATVVTASLSIPPLSPAEGEVWIVGDTASGDWVGQEQKLAQFMGGIWQFYAPFEGLKVWLVDENLSARFTAGIWQKGILHANRIEISGQQVIGQQQAAIADAIGGSTIDTEARAALNALLAACKAHGIIAM